MCVSNRYFATVSDSLSSSLPEFFATPEDYERLHVFDSMVGWRSNIATKTGGIHKEESLTTAGGLHFNGVYKSSSEEDSSSEEESSSEGESSSHASSNKSNKK